MPADETDQASAESLKDKPLSELMSQFESSPDGLTDDQVAQLKLWTCNILEGEPVFPFRRK